MKNREKTPHKLKSRAERLTNALVTTATLGSVSIMSCLSVFAAGNGLLNTVNKIATYLAGAASGAIILALIVSGLVTVFSGRDAFEKIKGNIVKIVIGSVIILGAKGVMATIQSFNGF